ncbi:MAG: hypothetical protein IPK82_11445 [Polyangiaceae bacterium]|nr:hypothetical protein [Polyangiaceae bacterium]
MVELHGTGRFHPSFSEIPLTIQTQRPATSQATNETLTHAQHERALLRQLWAVWRSEGWWSRNWYRLGYAILVAATIAVGVWYGWWVWVVAGFLAGYGAFHQIRLHVLRARTDRTAGKLAQMVGGRSEVSDAEGILMWLERHWPDATPHSLYNGSATISRCVHVEGCWGEHPILIVDWERTRLEPKKRNWTDLIPDSHRTPDTVVYNSIVENGILILLSGVAVGSGTADGPTSAMKLTWMRRACGTEGVWQGQSLGKVDPTRLAQMIENVVPRSEFEKVGPS